MTEEETETTAYPMIEQQHHQLDEPRHRRFWWRHYGSINNEEEDNEEEVDDSESSSPLSSSSEERRHQVGHQKLVKNHDDDQDCDDDIINDTTTTTTTVTYISLLRTNIPLRYFLASCCTNYIGEWLTYLAAVTAIKDIIPTIHLHNQSSSTSYSEPSISSSSQIYIGILVVIRSMSKVIGSTFGGVLADKFDKRILMIILHLLGSIVALFFILSVQLQSIHGIYVSSFLQELLSGLYEPICSSTIPMLTSVVSAQNNQNDNDDDEDVSLEKAVILLSISWSTIAAIGCALGGFLVSIVGCQGCFLVDSITYVIAAYFMFIVGRDGDKNISFKVSKELENHQLDDDDDTKNLLLETTATATPISTTPTTNGDNTRTCESCNYYCYWLLSIVTIYNVFARNFHDGICYIRNNSIIGGLIWLKFSIMWITLDVVNVSFAERTDDKSNDVPVRLGCLFSAIGIGSLLGPLVAERYFTNMNHLITLQTTILGSFGIGCVSCLCMSMKDVPFWVLCVLNAIRVAGIDAAWVNSELLLQKFSTSTMLGRVLSIDLALALVAESSSAMVAGFLQDKYNFTPEEVCRLLGSIGLILCFGWTIYHLQGGGAASSPLH